MVPPNGLGWIIVDALDTLMLMNLTTELAHARDWISTTLSYDRDHDVNTFETTIRMLGGLLSAHYLSTSFPDMAPLPAGAAKNEDLYLEKATDLADRLLGAYESNSGIPYASVNLHTMKGIPSHADAGASSTAEATSLQLEMKYLAKLTGETHYWEKAEKVMQVVDDNDAEDGLVPIFIYADKGTFRGFNIRLGSRGDSYYGERNSLRTAEIILMISRISHQAVLANHKARNGLPRNVGPGDAWHSKTPHNLLFSFQFHSTRRTSQRYRRSHRAQDGSSRLLHAWYHCVSYDGWRKRCRSQKTRQMDDEARGRSRPC
jgi:Glycosyl hydrolase family 47